MGTLILVTSVHGRLFNVLFHVFYPFCIHETIEQISFHSYNESEKVEKTNTSDAAH